MTTTPIKSITDELLAEIEANAAECISNGNWYTKDNIDAALEFPCDLDYVLKCSPEVAIALTTELRRLRAENEALRVDAGRYRWLLENADMMHWENMLHFSDLDGIESVSAFIDTAMQSNAKGN